MNFTNDWIAHVLAHDYGFHPADGGKFEPDDKIFDERCFRIAHLVDATNVLILFNPVELKPDED